MALEFTCSYCQGSKGTRIDTYKHYWVVCHNCDNAIHIQKDQYALPRLFPGPMSHLVPKKIKKLFFSAAEVKEDQSLAYEYYAGVSGNQSAIGTKWEGEYEKMRKDLNNFGIDLKDKSVLDISGGPGFKALEMKGTVRRVLVTEYSQVAVDGMVENLGIDVVKYDFNEDKLEDIIEEKFDVIMAMNSLNYCIDMGAFAKSLRSVMHKDSRIFLNYFLPTLGCMLRSQLQEYNYNLLYNDKSVKESFEDAGIEIVAGRKWQTGFYGRNYTSRYSGWSLQGMMLKFLRFASSVPYLLSGIFKSKVDKSLNVQVQILVLKLKSAEA